MLLRIVLRRVRRDLAQELAKPVPDAEVVAETRQAIEDAERYLSGGGS
jgi:hypothetical protein